MDEANPRFAFVDFSSPENQKLAVDLSERLLEGRKLLIKLGKSLFLIPCLDPHPLISSIYLQSLAQLAQLAYGRANKQETTTHQTQKPVHQNQ